MVCSEGHSAIDDISGSDVVRDGSEDHSTIDDISGSDAVNDGSVESSDVFGTSVEPLGVLLSTSVSKEELG